MPILTKHAADSSSLQLVYPHRRHLSNKVRAFTEEGMRLRAPTQGLSTRMTTQDEVFQDVEVPAGSLLHMRWAAANMDPDEWECPHELRLDRKAGTRHLTFSQGARVCPGATLSRLEQTIAWDALLDRIDGVAYAPGNTFLPTSASNSSMISCDSTLTWRCHRPA